MRRTPGLVWALGLLLTLYMAAPFAAAATQVFAIHWTDADLRGLLSATATSLASASVSTAFVALGGVPLAFLLAHKGSAAWRGVGFLIQLPLALPPLSSGVLLLFLLGYASPLGRLTHGALTDSFLGIVLAEAFVSAPFLIIAARSAFAEVDPQIEDVAATLGHGPASVFGRVSLRLAWPSILAGLLLAWLRAFGEFGATVLVAYHPFSLPVFTYLAFNGEGLPAMAPVILVTILVALGLLTAMEAVRVRKPPDRPRAAEPLPVLRGALPALQHSGVGLRLRAERRLSGFELKVDWTTGARRLAILGPSGSGKSLTLRLIAGLDRDGAIEVSLGGRNLHSLPPEQRNVGYVPQSYALLPGLPLDRQVRFAADADPDRAKYLIGRLALDGLEARMPHELSLGQQQRVALARALSRAGTNIFLLDEPFSALDRQLRLQLRDDLRRLQNEITATTIVVTHDPDEAMALADDLLLLANGSVLQAGPVRELYLRPANEAVAKLLGAETGGHGRMREADLIDVGQGVLLRTEGPTLPIGADVGWSVRARHVRLSRLGAYPVYVRGVAPAVGGERSVDILLGDVALTIIEDASFDAHGWARADIDPLAMQVWMI